MASKNTEEDAGEPQEACKQIQDDPDKLTMAQEDLDPFIKRKINRITLDNMKYELDAKELCDQISNPDGNDTVTIVYPTSHISLLSTSDDRLVNLVEFPNIEGVGSHLELDGNTYNLLSQGFENDTQISIMAADTSDAQLGFGHPGDEQGFFQHSGPAVSKPSTSSILPEQLLQLSSGEVIDSSNNISLPLSLVTKGNSVLQGLSTIPVTLSYDGSTHSQSLASRQPPTVNYNIRLESNNKEDERSPTLVAKKQETSSLLQKDPSKHIISKKARANQVGRPPKQETCNKIIGSGPTAISAEGVVHTVGNRLVTVLPRPEDVQKLVASKKLVMKLKRNGSRTSLLDKNAKRIKLSAVQGILNQNLPDTSIEDELRPRVNVKQYKKRGRRRKEKPARSPFVVSSGGKRPGRPRKVQTVLGGPNGPRIIHTGPDRTQSQTESTSENVTTAAAEPTHLIEAKQKPAEFDFFSGDLSKKVLPPRRRGTRYQEMLQAIKTSETEDHNFSTDEDEAPQSYSDNLDQYASKNKSTIHQGSSKKEFLHEFESNFDDRGTRIIQLGENLNPIETRSSSKILVEEGQDFEKSAENIVLSFQQPPVKTLNKYNSEKSLGMKNSVIEMQINEDATTNISVLNNDNDNLEDDMTTIFVKEEENFEEMYECVECKRFCDTKEEYVNHMNEEHGTGSFECTDCGKLFMVQHELNAHQASHECLEYFTCNICQEILTSEELFKSHQLSHSSNRTFPCSRCDLTFDDVHDLNFHLRKMECVYESSQSSEKLFICDICKASFVASSGLNKHRKVHRLGIEDSINKYKCSVCHANFTYKESLDDHTKAVHQDPVMVESAPKEKASMIEKLQDKLNEGYAPKNSELYDVPQASEIADHKNKEPFLCGVCDEAFVDIDVLCDHSNNCHTASQTVCCELCGVGCSSQEQLEKHKAVHEKEEQQAALPAPDDHTSFVCTYCGKRFMKSQDLEKHTKLHTQEKTYLCQVCDASFLLKSTLEKHKLVHTGHRPYVCDICLKSFRQSASLIRHKLWTHSLKNQNKCSICSKTFFTENLLIHHLGTHGEAGEKEKKEIDQKVLVKDEDEESESSKGKESMTGDGKNLKCEYCDKVCTSMVALLSHKLVHKKSNSYCCVDCNRTFREKRYLKKHRLTHRGLKSWRCNICDKAFATKLTLIRHSQVHIRESLRPDLNISLVTEDSTAVGSSLPSVLECEECNRSFEHKSHYVRHKLLHSGVALLKCGICDRLFVHKSDLIRHKVMHSLMFSCDVCGRNFHKRSLYLIHKQRHLDGRPFKCEKCNKSFSSAGNYMVHLRIHSGEKPYECNMCNYRCAQSGRLKRHKRMHYNMKTYPCDLCSKTFATLESVQSHKLIHSEHRPFTCNLCPKGFYNKNSLSQHLKEHDREQEYSCTVCPHKFRREEHLIKHKMFHEKSSFDGQFGSSAEASLFMCDKCGRVFDKKKYLYTHQNIHSNNNKFQCDCCSKVLGSRVGLKNHMMIHSGQMPFNCEICSKEFRTISNLNRHKKSHAKYSCDVCSRTFDLQFQLDEHKSTHMDIVMPEEPADPPQQMYVLVDDGMDAGPQQLLVENNQQFLVDGSQSILVFPESRYTDIAETSQSTGDLKIEPMTQEVIEADYLIAQESPPPSDAQAPDPLPSDTVAKPHECDVCHKTFAKKQYLTKHKYRHRQVKPHQCEVCQKTFAQKFEVAVHMMKHTGARPFRCDVCQKDFRSRANLVNHKMRHTGEYPFMCSICDKGLSTQLQLEKHVSLHTGSYPHSCPHCSRGFSTNSTLTRHLYRCHELKLNASTNEHLESLEAVANIPQTEDKTHMLSFVKKEKENDIGISVQNIDMSGISELEDTEFSVQVQNPYLKNCILEGQTDLEQKFLSSILHQDEESCNSDNNEVNLGLLSTDLDAS